MLNDGQQHFAKLTRLADCYACSMVMLNSKENRARNLAMLHASWKAERKKDKDLALVLDVPASYLSQLLSGHRAIGDDVARKIESRLSLTPGQLDNFWASEPVSGTNVLAFTPPVRVSSVKESPAGDYVQIPFAPHVVGESGGEDVLIPFYTDIRAAAGAGAANGEAIEPLHLKFRGESLRRKGINPATAMVIYADGDSMEPLIDNRDTIMFDTSKTDILDGKLYVIEVDGEALVKRLHRRPGARVLIKSENEAYPPYEIALETTGFRVLGRVVWGAGWLL